MSLPLMFSRINDARNRMFLPSPDTSGLRMALTAMGPQQFAPPVGLSPLAGMSMLPWAVESGIRNRLQSDIGNIRQAIADRERQISSATIKLASLAPNEVERKRMSKNESLIALAAALASLAVGARPEYVNAGVGNYVQGRQELLNQQYEDDVARSQREYEARRNQIAAQLGLTQRANELDMAQLKSEEDRIRDEIRQAREDNNWRREAWLQMELSRIREEGDDRRAQMQANAQANERAMRPVYDQLEMLTRMSRGFGPGNTVISLQEARNADRAARELAQRYGIPYESPFAPRIQPPSPTGHPVLDALAFGASVASAEPDKEFIKAIDDRYNQDRSIVAANLDRLQAQAEAERLLPQLRQDELDFRYQQLAAQIANNDMVNARVTASHLNSIYNLALSAHRSAYPSREMFGSTPEGRKQYQEALARWHETQNRLSQEIERLARIAGGNAPSFWDRLRGMLPGGERPLDPFGPALGLRPMDGPIGPPPPPR